MEKDTEAFILEAHFLVLPLVTESHHGNLCCVSYSQAKISNKIPQNNCLKNQTYKSGANVLWDHMLRRNWFI